MNKVIPGLSKLSKIEFELNFFLRCIYIIFIDDEILNILCLSGSFTIYYPYCCDMMTTKTPE